jgi:DNA polymerase-3 subunit delta'
VTGVTGTFDVVGAEAALAFFGSLDARRIAHGYLFTGPGGVGKKTFARRLAQSLLCDTPKPTLLGYCATCASCKLFFAGTHPDFVFSEGTIKIGKDPGNPLHDEEITARDLVRELALRAYRGNYRVVLLGDVDFATHEAANALLKFFEEPPSGVVVLLTTSSPGSLLETIRSRFIDIAFGPLRTRDVQRVLESGGVAEDRAHFAAESSLGSITRARAILDDDDLGVREASFAWFSDAVRGKIPDGAFLRLDDRSISGAEKRRAVGELIELSRIAVRDWAALTLAGSDGIPVLASDQRARIADLPARDATAIVNLLAALSDVGRVANSNVSAGLVVDYLRMQLAQR